MMLWKGRGGRPATRDGGGTRRHSIIEAPRTAIERPNVSDLVQTASKDSINNGSDHSIGVLPFEQGVNSAGSPFSSRDWMEPQEPAQAQEPKDSPTQTKRFSLMKFRHASDPQLSKSYAAAENSPSPPTLPPPMIITTSPTTQSLEQPQKQKTKRKLFSRPSGPFTRHSERGRKKHPLQETQVSESNLTPEIHGAESNGNHISFEEPSRLPALGGAGAPPAYGDDSSTSLAIPVSRISESSRSDGSSGDHGIYAQTTTTHTISTTTTFFRMPRRKKDKGPLFPLPAKLPAPDPSRSSAARTPRASTSGRTSMSPERALGTIFSDSQEGENDSQPSPFPSPTHSTLALTNAPHGQPIPAILRKKSSMSQRSGQSTPSLQVPPPRIGQRGRSSTMGSLRKSAEKDLHDSPPLLTPAGRNSTSTTGRKSFGDIFSLSHRLRQNSEPPPRNGPGLPGTPGSTGSKATSFQLPREYPYPERNEEDTPASYLTKLEAAVPRGVMAAILCKGSDEFSKTCLRKYMRGFSYFVDPIDMAVRKMLMEVELPKETQQIDRLLQGFANRYCECNPGIFISIDEAYFVAFSILLLHSDTHNKNNKRKMQRQDYVKNTQDEVEVSRDILECFYDNVSYTPFIHFEDDVAVNSHRLAVPKSRKGLFRSPSSESLRGPVDPYTLILDNKLDVLRPSLKEVMDTEDTYNSLGTAGMLDVTSLHEAFFRSGILQIVSARSRPDAFATQATISNPAEAQAGLVDIKAAKVGLLWRKDPKKKKTKSPWQEWGAILTSSQLYFFRDVGWIKRLMLQHESHQKLHAHVGPVLFKPPLTNFEPDAFMSMDDAVALLDSGYKKHKNAFVFIKHGGFEEVFLANDEGDMNDWISKLNYAATFRTAGVRMKGHIGPTYEEQRRPITRSSSSTVERIFTPPTRNSSAQLIAEVMVYRRQIMEEKISEATEKLNVTQKELDSLLRNARHLQVLTPIQAKTREALILAAGRMSAKLKWTRVEMSRTKCHRDILKLDLGQGDDDALPDDSLPSKSLPQKVAPIQINHRLSNKSTSTVNENLALPKSPVLPQTPQVNPQATIDKRSLDLVSKPLSSTPSHASHQKSLSSLSAPSATENESIASSGEGIHLATTSPGSHSLVHQTSIISSHRRPSDPDSHITSPTNDIDDGEAQILREAGLLATDGTPPSTKRPGTSGSEHDRVGAISPMETPPKDRSAVRRSLHRTLRDSPNGPHLPHLPHHHRSKKGRDSNSSVAVTEDRNKAGSSESDGLARGTGSFIVHGKKASVITFGSEWQAMSNEERLKLRKLAQAEGAKEENAVEDGTASHTSGPSVVPEVRSRTNSTITAGTDRDEGIERVEGNAVKDHE